MKDFSIESILADTFIFEQKSHENASRYDLNAYEDIKKETDRKYFEMDGKINVNGANTKQDVGNGRENSKTNSGKYCDTKREECAINLKKTWKFGEEDNCDVNLTKMSETDVEDLAKNWRRSSREFRVDFERYGKYETWGNSLWVMETECNRYVNKLNSNCFNSIKETPDIINLKSNFTMNAQKGATNNAKTSNEKRELNDTKVAEIVERMERRSGIDETTQSAESDLNYAKTSINNIEKTSKANNRQKGDFAKHLKKGGRRKIDREKKQSKKNQCEVFDTDGNKDFNENSLKYNPSGNSEISKNVETTENMRQLEWLQFTRYKPPKLPRKPAIGKNKRKPCLHPRIPFSSSQLDCLEQKFRSSAYISKEDLLDISVALKLQPSRVKIWFQNRRARERREFHTNVE